MAREKVLKAGPGSHRRWLSLLLCGADSRQGLGRGIDRWGNSPVLLSQYDEFVLCVQPGELIPPGPLGGLYTDAPRGGVSLRGIILLCGQAPRLASARPPDQSDVVPHD